MHFFRDSHDNTTLFNTCFVQPKRQLRSPLHFEPIFLSTLLTDPTQIVLFVFDVFRSFVSANKRIVKKKKKTIKISKHLLKKNLFLHETIHHNNDSNMCED